MFVATYLRGNLRALIGAFCLALILRQLEYKTVAPVAVSEAILRRFKAVFADRYTQLFDVCYVHIRAPLAVLI